MSGAIAVRKIHKNAKPRVRLPLEGKLSPQATDEVYSSQRLYCQSDPFCQRRLEGKPPYRLLPKNDKANA